VLYCGVDTLLTAVPYLLGFHPPTGSLVLVGLRDHLVAVLLARPLPDTALASPDEIQDTWTHTSRVIAANACHGVIAIAYTTAHRLDDVRRVIDAAPVPVLHTLQVDGCRWWDLDRHHHSDHLVGGRTGQPTDQSARCTRPECTPTGQVIPDDLTVTATMISAGRGIPGTRHDLDRILLPGPADLLDAVTTRLPLTPVPSREDLFTALTEAHTARAERPQPLTPDLAAVLLQGLTHLDVRDACLAWHDDAAWWLWTDLIHAAPHGWIAPVASVIAVLAYQRGDGILAAIAAEHALLDHPDYRLARLVLGLLDVGTTPTQLRGLIHEALTQLPPDLRPTTRDSHTPEGSN
jgi:hypothetical protein